MTGIFERPQWLFTLFALIPSYGFYRYRLSKLGAGLARLSGRDSDRFIKPLRRRALYFAAAWVCLAAALAGPRLGTRPVPVRQEGSSVMIVVDVSRSMTVSDILPDRLSFAARYASLLADRLGPVSCGITLTKGSGALAVPITRDRQAISDLLDSLSPSLLSSPGSSLAAGVRTAIQSFPDSDASARKILLLTDGDETAGSLEDAALEAGRAGITLVIAGIGTAGGAALDVDPDPAPDRVDFRTTVLREDSLRAAAEAAGGKSAYINASDAGSALRVLDLLGSSGSSGPELRYTDEPVDRYPEFVFASLLFFAVALVTGGAAWQKKRG